MALEAADEKAGSFHQMMLIIQRFDFPTWVLHSRNKAVGISAILLAEINDVGAYKSTPSGNVKRE